MFQSAKNALGADERRNGPSLRSRFDDDDLEFPIEGQCSAARFAPKTLLDRAGAIAFEGLPKWRDFLELARGCGPAPENQRAASLEHIRAIYSESGRKVPDQAHREPRPLANGMHWYVRRLFKHAESRHVRRPVDAYYSLIIFFKCRCAESENS
jgi:hypothetical protein